MNTLPASFFTHDRLDRIGMANRAIKTKRMKMVACLLEVFGFDEEFSINDVSEYFGRWNIKSRWKIRYGKKALGVVVSLGFVDVDNDRLYRITTKGRDAAESYFDEGDY